jgi:aryl-alcohol dehydrogenase-like predicted oxidoreductase
VVIATKVAGYSDTAKYLRQPPETARVNAKQIKAAVDGSLARLGVDTIDLLQVHWYVRARVRSGIVVVGDVLLCAWGKRCLFTRHAQHLTTHYHSPPLKTKPKQKRPDRYVPLFGAAAYDPANERADDVPFDEQLRGLEDVVRAGKVRYIGVSNETSYGVGEFARLAAAAGLPKIQTIQNCYHLLCRSAYETDLAEMCRCARLFLSIVVCCVVYAVGFFRADTPYSHAHHPPTPPRPLLPSNTRPRSRHNVSLLAYSPIAGGALSGKYLNNDAPANARFNLFKGYMNRHVQFGVFGVGLGGFGCQFGVPTALCPPHDTTRHNTSRHTSKTTTHNPT